jgi:hypothetical protein
VGRYFDANDLTQCFGWLIWKRLKPVEFERRYLREGECPRENERRFRNRMRMPFILMVILLSAKVVVFIRVFGSSWAYKLWS